MCNKVFSFQLDKQLVRLRKKTSQLQEHVQNIYADTQQLAM
jgi:hypothetical protein